MLTSPHPQLIWCQRSYNNSCWIFKLEIVDINFDKNDIINKKKQNLLCLLRYYKRWRSIFANYHEWSSKNSNAREALAYRKCMFTLLGVVTLSLTTKIVTFFVKKTVQRSGVRNDTIIRNSKLLYHYKIDLVMSDTMYLLQITTWALIRMQQADQKLAIAKYLENETN